MQPFLLREAKMRKYTFFSAGEQILMSLFIHRHVLVAPPANLAQKSARKNILLSSFGEGHSLPVGQHKLVLWLFCDTSMITRVNISISGGIKSISCDTYECKHLCSYKSYLNISASISERRLSNVSN
jgi:hypothetical protein